MIALPFNLWRVQTNEFSYGMDFFLRAVLQLKVAAVTPAEISKLLGFDPKLVEKILDELKYKGFLDSNYVINKAGRGAIEEEDDLVISPKKRETGYVLQRLDTGELYPYYVSRIQNADLRDGGGQRPRVVVGQKGDGDDYAEYVQFIEEPWINAKTQAKPSPRDILSLIRKSNKKRRHSDGDGPDEAIPLDERLRLLDIQFTEENPVPEPRWVATYLYFTKRPDGSFSPDWKIRDPFGFGKTSAFCQLYAGNPDNKGFLKCIDKKFGGIKVIGEENLREFNKQRNEKIAAELRKFSGRLANADEELKGYVHTLAESYILYEQLSERGRYDSLLVYLQKILENIFLQDQEKNRQLYERTSSIFDKQVKLRGQELLKMWKFGWFSPRGEPVPDSLFKATTELRNWKSLRGYLLACILSFSFKLDKTRPLHGLLNGKIDGILEIASLRNESAHGKTENTSLPSARVSEQEIKKHYEFVRDFVNDFLSCTHP